MRRLLPFIIVAVGLAAVAIDLLPNLPRPGSDPPQRIETKLGLDLQGGLRGEYQAYTADGRAISSADMGTIRTIIENRVNATGVAEPIVQTQGTDRIVVEIPGVSDVDAVRKLIGSTGLLTFVPLPVNEYGTEGQPGSKPVPGQGEPIDPNLKPLFTGDQLASAAPGFDQTTGKRAVSFELKSEADRKFADYSRASVGQYFAIVLDGTVQSAPTIKEPITDGRSQISGTYSDC